MVEYEVTAVKHDELRNEKKCAKYWCIDNDADPGDEFIYDHWFCKDIPKRILDILETAPEDPEGFGLKRGQFILALKQPINPDDFGHITDFKTVVSIKFKEVGECLRQS